MAALGKTIGEIIAGTANNKRAIDALTGVVLGTDAPLLHRADAGDTSVQAAYSVDTSSVEEKVLVAIRAAGKAGTTQDALLEALPWITYPTLTARFSALLRKGLIIDTGDRALGKSGRKQRVIRATEAGRD
jgi:hypothetical protein